jgi:hypothetical protein
VHFFLTTALGAEITHQIREKKRWRQVDVEGPIAGRKAGMQVLRIESALETRTSVCFKPKTAPVEAKPRRYITRGNIAVIKKTSWQRACFEFNREQLMNVRYPLSILAAASSVLTGAGCGNAQFTHVKPGQSARMAVLIQTAPIAQQRKLLAKPGSPTRKSPEHYAEIEALALDVPAPGLPDANPPVAQAAELFARSGTAVRAGQTGEAILALEEAVHIDPAFTDAWSQLANLYQNAGQAAKANEASKKARDLVQSKSSNALIPGEVPELNP